MADALLGPDETEFADDMIEDEDEAEFEEDDIEGEEDVYDDDEEYEDEEGEEFEEDELAAPFASEAPAASIAGMLSNMDDISVAEGEMQEVENPSNEDVQITVDVLQHILQYMNIRAVVQVRSTSPLSLNIQGINENLGLLIGRRGE